ncbi:TIGR00341 family protein [Winogradskyella litorisediminis]|uniref:TIGR00341 family protein n=1 Tax=Winogradskyella litorisediminis TaxID=1156618 RepID=A0ABW3NB08_9FLAO
MSEENKFNFSDDESEFKEPKVKATPTGSIKDSSENLFQSISFFFRELLDFRNDTDRDTTINAIKSDISFQGATAWILICSIFVASVGLNADSTAVVIGAMLVSPLMGPILGVGLSIAINDIDTLKKSIINLLIMIVLSLITAFLFFYFFPLSEDTSELLGRTHPDFRDVLIAFFGGLALIIARCKKGTIASVIFGVAIATALMPPLCTAGYGLAKGNWSFFFGAMYLFAINTIFIALASFLVLKLLKFPMLKYANSKKRRNISRIASILAIVVTIPAIFTFIDVIRESRFETAARNFINSELETLPNSRYIKQNATYEYVKDGQSVIYLRPFATDEISEDSRNFLDFRLKDEAYSSLGNTKLEINQVKNRVINNLEYMEQLRTRDSLDLLTQGQKIIFLENKVKELSRLEQNQIPFDQIVKEAKINYEELESISYAEELTSNFKKIDTIPIFSFKWNDSLTSPEIRLKNSKKLGEWLKLKLAKEPLVIRNVN